jgi:hypothetical protein
VKVRGSADTCVCAGDFDSALHVKEVAGSEILSGRSFDNFEVAEGGKFDREVWLEISLQSLTKFQL